MERETLLFRFPIFSQKTGETVRGWGLALPEFREVPWYG
jgi:hypothetical protein